MRSDKFIKDFPLNKNFTFVDVGNFRKDFLYKIYIGFIV